MDIRENILLVCRAIVSAVIIAFLFVGVTFSAVADGLPRTFGWTAYGTTSGGYAVSVAIGNALADDGYRLRVIPGKNDIARVTPLRAERVHFSATGIGSYLAQEGVNEFASRRWGPQSVRLIMMGWSDAGIGVPVAAGDAGISAPYDFVGKRIAWVVGGPALNMNMTGWLAFANLGWDDVIRVEVSGLKSSLQGLIDGTIDAAIAGTNTSMLYQLEGSPRGLHFVPGPHDDLVGWERLKSVAPWQMPHIATAGVGLLADKVLESGAYPYPILITYANRDEQMAYDLTRLLHVNFEEYKDAHSFAIGFALDRQVFDWIVPYHAGSIRYFREIGVWTEEYEAHNQGLIDRQRVLQEAWENVRSSDRTGNEFLDFWLEKRTSALEAAGMDSVW